ncbi:MAG TPA: methyltransferase domain-containing protein [Tepidiformaceae bacterium]|nr:methyltransferase domain-containing protein [Tepidiformaceae bacterium]
MRQDTCFDEIASAFEDDVYGGPKGVVRLEVWTDLLAAVPEIARGGLSILDAGRGAGHMAVRLATAGSRIILCDTSREMLDRAATATCQAGVESHVSLVQASIQELHERVGERFDVVLCHAVLE